MFKALGKLSCLAQKEEEILEFWKNRDIFKKSLKQREGSPRFTFYEGPPTTNGYPHAGHVIGRSIKDLIPRYRTMCGYYAPRRAGWDTHGLPVELEVEKELGISGKPDIERYGVDKFNEKCKESVFKYIKEWEKLTERLGIWMDLEHPYITCSNEYIETLWWVLKELWERGLLYEGHKVLPYCARCGTSLSSHEVALGYQETEDPSLYVKFALRDREKTYFLVWTTTPWTLAANVALAVGKNINYLEVVNEENGEHYILSEDSFYRLLGEDTHYKVIRKYRGEELVGIKYEPLLDFVVAEKGYEVFSADFVTTEEGTGVVHIAPAFGEDDLQLAQQEDLPLLQPVRRDGKYGEEIIPWQGMWVKDADPLIIDYLEEKGKLFKKETYRHSYPFCWRCDTPLLYYAKESWFIRTTSFRDALLENNQKINWYPSHIKEGRFGDFLSNVVDWALSRERYWGTPLNIWQCKNCNFKEAIGSIEELKNRSREKIEEIELHRPYVDRITLSCPQCGGVMERVPEVVDCWFDSGAMFVAQLHFPFENEEEFQQSFPADFICEAIDQTRGWFYSLHVLATALFNSPAYRNCLVTELGLDEKGQKMSIDRELLLAMEVARKLTNLGRSVRNKVNIKLRQPLRKAIMVVPQEKERERALPFTSIIQEELNVREIEWISHLPEEVTVSLKPRFSVLGPRYGQKVKEIARLLKNLEEDKSRQFWEMGEVSLLLEGEEVILKREEVELELQAREGLAVESEGEYAVILDTFLDQELQEEGMVRDLIHAIQIWRKEAGLEVEDRIELEVREGTDPEWIDLIEKYSSLIQDEVLASSLSLCGDGEREIISKEWELNGKKLVLALRRRL